MADVAVTETTVHDQHPASGKVFPEEEEFTAGVGDSLQRFDTIPDLAPPINKKRRRTGASWASKLSAALSSPFARMANCGPVFTRQRKSNAVFRVEYACKGAGINAPSREDRVVVIEDYESFVRDGYAAYDTRKFGDVKPGPPPSSSFKTPEITGSHPEQTPVENFKLFAVFDGHCGAIASTFMQYRFPYELAGTTEFHNGDYKQALTVAFQRAHAALLECKSYAPEAPSNDFSSGCTASVVLVTPTVTYFAMVGDSPIMIWKQNQPNPELLFKEHDAGMLFILILVGKTVIELTILKTALLDNPNIFPQIVGSNMFLVMVREVDLHNVYYIVTSAGMRAKLLDLAAASSADEHDSVVVTPQPNGVSVVVPEDVEESIDSDEQGKDTAVMEKDGDTEKTMIHDEKALEAIKPPEFSAIPGADEEDEEIQFDDLRIGMSALNVFGTLGDSFYDPQVFNTFIDELVVFRQDRVWRYNNHVEKVKTNPAELDPKKRRSTGDGTSRKTPKRNRKDTPESTVPISSSVSPTIGTTPDGTTPISPVSATGPQVPSVKFAFEKMTSLSDLEGVNPLEFPYSELREWMLARPAWGFLSKHLSLLKKETQMSRVLLSAVRGLDHRHHLASPGLVRVPDVTSIPNHELRSFVVASDGVIRFFKRFKKVFQEIISRNAETPEKCVEEMMNNLKWLRDDRSIIVCRFGIKLPQPV
ncbi:hypothetical protein SmJEL517_g01283 [Synchytrium microbalum]|uniref:PPM-type phosphatase domain-containing protein n=1 Tax=Synchytrium microbalum TaxID=1806994 RepID=A0A507C5B2_9FUNG|nr:uncharacterized protein SmJEL517_g01283 [Synchytrium microbalum]TPX36740.1 hypothetical protein SmJEL517_g01283 [Synchytrium microbalum]